MDEDKDNDSLERLKGKRKGHRVVLTRNIYETRAILEGDAEIQQRCDIKELEETIEIADEINEKTHRHSTCSSCRTRTFAITSRNSAKCAKSIVAKSLRTNVA